MNLSLTGWIIAILPIVLLIILLTIFKLSVIKSSILTLIITLFTTYFYFKAGIYLMLIEALKGGWNSLTIIAVVFPAILVYEIIYNGNCISIINNSLELISSNELFKILLVGWVFTSFLQSITGFGVPVAICAPLLITMGVKPKWAIIISLLGQSWGNTFGTLAVAWDIIVDISGITGNALFATATWAASFLWIINLASGFVICWIYGKWDGIKKGLLIVLIISLVHGGGELLVVQYNQTVAAFIPSTFALLIMMFISKLPTYKHDWHLADSKIMINERINNNKKFKQNYKKIIIGFSPFIVLVVVTILLLVIEPINSFLGQWSFGLSFPKTITGYGIVNNKVAEYSPIKPLVDSGTVLFLTCLFSYIILRKNNFLKKRSYKVLLENTLIKTIPTAISIILLLTISKWMSGSGQTLMISAGITKIFGKYYVIMAGSLGVIGSFITGSNMSSNILFTDVQMNVSSSLGVDYSIILGAQTAGGAIGSVIAPSKIVLGTISAGINGKEGEILKELISFAIICTILIGIVCWLVI